MSTVSLTLDEIFDLAKKTLLANGCDDETASLLSNLIRNAERDGSVSHGLFRLPAYVSGLKSGKINGKGKPEVKKISASVIKVKDTVLIILIYIFCINQKILNYI